MKGSGRTCISSGKLSAADDRIGWPSVRPDLWQGRSWILIRAPYIVPSSLPPCRRERCVVVAQLIFKKGPFAGRVVQLPAQRVLVIGRRHEADVPLTDPKLSRNHCQLAASGTFFFVKDLESRNGTFVNGRRLAAEVELKQGDIINLGDSEIEFRDTSVSEAESADPRQAALADALADLNRPLPPEPPALPKGAPELKEVLCQRCGRVVSQLELALGLSQTVHGLCFCRECLANASQLTSGNVPKPAGEAESPGAKSIDEILADLDQEAVLVDTSPLTSSEPPPAGADPQPGKRPPQPEKPKESIGDDFEEITDPKADR